jgi:L-alanine-DL-glutamate epimerase-like enolase superfamily enzyme
MKIASIDAQLYRIPLPHVLSDSIHGDMPGFELVTARVRTHDGLEGLGYTYTVGRGGSAILAMIVDDLAPLLIGADPRRTGQAWDRMWWAIHWVGRGGVSSFAMAALDVALWDIKAKAAGEPLWRLLGGASNRVRAYAGGIDLFFTLDQLQAQTEGFLASGFRAIKVKAGRDLLAEDVERIRAVRSIVGPSFTLMADANCRWSTSQAIRAARALQTFDLFWLEEPTVPDDVDGFARIASEGGLPIATGENMHTVFEFERMIRHGRIAFPQPDLSNLGGITPWLQVAQLAHAHHLPVTSHGVHDLHVHLLAAVPNASYLEVHGFGLERFQSRPLRFEKGEAVAPDTPGHGVDLEPAVLEQYLAARTPCVDALT